LENNKNEASFLVANSIKLLPKPMIVVSFADTSQGHVGYVYQATNFLYTGLSANRVDWTIKGQEHKHAKTIGDGLTLSEIKELHGDDFYYVERSRKHRYILFHGSKTDKRIMLSKLKYEIEPYPKGDSKRYDSGKTVKTQQLLFV
jgi:hypothetical protein